MGGLLVRDYIIRATAGNLGIRAFCGVTTNMVEKSRRLHNTTPVASAALGRTLTAASMMGLMMKNEGDRLTIIIKGEGPLKGITVAANSKGTVKGYVENPLIDIPLKYQGKLDVSGAVGDNGYITVIKDLGLKKPYIGKYPLTTGEIAEDFTAYFAYSEQQPSSVALGVLVDRDYSIKAAGGFIVQLMPDASEEAITILEQNLNNISPVSSLIADGKTPEDIVDMLFKNLDYRIYEKNEVEFECDCSKEKLEKALITLGKETLTEILEEDSNAQLVCHFCNSSYEFSDEDLKNIISKI